MKLQSYVKVEDGMVYELSQIQAYVFESEAGVTNIEFANKEFHLPMDTADDIFELVEKGWLAKCNDFKPVRVLVVGESDDGVGHYIEIDIEAGGRRFYSKNGSIKALYAPITLPGGTLSCYKLVWQY